MAPFFHAVNLTTWKVLGFSKKCSLQAKIFLQAQSARRGAQTYAHTTKVWQISRHRKKNQETVSKEGNLAAAEKVKKWRTKMAFSYSQVHFFALPKHHVICAAVSFFERIGRNGGRHGCLQPRHLTHLNYISVLFSYSLRLPLSIYRNFMRGTISQSWCLTAWNFP